MEWEPWHSCGIRKFPVGRYIIFYEVIPDMLEVKIIRILSGSRNAEEVVNGDE